MKHSVFAVEICMRFDPNTRLFATLRALLAAHPMGENLQQKWEWYRRVAGELLSASSAFERGCWDYYDDEAQAQGAYRDYASTVVTEDGARKAPSGDDPYRNEPRYMTFTMAFLLVNEAPTDRAIRQICNVPESRYWLRDTFRQFLSSIASGILNFANVKSDVAYMIPRDAGWGLTQQDLMQPNFHYLRPLV
ncbi:MAG: hypothetical protein FWD69_05420 [Polyangiaceae bacterium]|nr:hypothetical protein [Polyangiaceae bacterium]